MKYLVLSFTLLALILICCSEKKAEPVLKLCHETVYPSPSYVGSPFQDQLLKGRQAMMEDSIQKALSIYSKILAVDSNQIDAIYAVGYIFDQGEQAEAAYYYTSKAYKLDPEYRSIAFNYARVFQLMGAMDSAAFYFTKAIQKDSLNIFAWINRGAVYYQNDKKDLACADWNRICDDMLEKANILPYRDECYQPKK